MILEIAEIEVKPGTEAQFEAGVAAAAPLFRAATGCLGMELQRTVERPTCYRLFVRWQTIENHNIDFRQSQAFQQWRALVGGYFAGAPRVEHVATVLRAF